jgi:hypothetical protein
MKLLGDVSQVETRFGPFGHRCMDWDEYTISTEIVLGTPKELLGGSGQMEARFSLFGDCANLEIR